MVQQAVVQSFLRNDAKAMECLQVAARTHHSPSIFILLGKTQMKAHRFMEVVWRIIIFLIICSQWIHSYIYTLHQGEEHVLPQALDAFSTALRINPDHADAFHQRGLCRLRLQQPKNMQDFNRALQINPDAYQVYLSRAALYGANGRYSKAILNCNEAIRIQPKSVRAYLYRGALKIYLKVYKEAVKDLTMAIKIDAACSLAYYNRGVCYQQLREYELALRDYSIVLLLPSQKETDLKVLINRALVYAELNDHYSTLVSFQASEILLSEAEEAHTEALRLNPFLLDAYVGRGNVFMDYGHIQATKQAQRDFLSALHHNPCCSSARIGLAYNFQVCGFFQRAWNQFTVAVEINPKSWTAYEGRAVVSLQMGNAYASFQDINNALKVSSDRLLTNRGVINQFMGDKPSALRDYQEAISLNPTYALAFFNAANLFFYNRQFEQVKGRGTAPFSFKPLPGLCCGKFRNPCRTLVRRFDSALSQFVCTSTGPTCMSPSEDTRLQRWTSHTVGHS
uniref:Tetratricopeptide repeat domain 6 n=1 Tax=Electrophorus electricus TaxID=8005 RepID=A0A4W4E8J3_ELEEL